MLTDSTWKAAVAAVVVLLVLTGAAAAESVDTDFCYRVFYDTPAIVLSLSGSQSFNILNNQVFPIVCYTVPKGSRLEIDNITSPGCRCRCTEHEVML